MSSHLNIAGVLLAAGESRRLGQPKQLVEFDGQPLVVRASNQLKAAGCDFLVAVLGANAELIRPTLHSAKIQTVLNDNWQSGMASSIACALAQLSSKADGVLIALCDQPLIETQHYCNLLESVSRDEHAIAATAYPSGRSGVPAVFLREHFVSLGDLNGEPGAKALIKSQLHSRVKVTGQLIDLDTAEDLKRIRDMHAT